MPRKPGRKKKKQKTQLVRMVPTRRRRPTKLVISGVFPKQKRVNMRFCTTVAIDSTGTSIAQASFRANGISDPDVALGGKRPIAYDQWSQWYNHYIVVGAKATFKLFPETNTTNVPNAVGVFLSDDTTIPNAYDSIIMQDRGMYKLVPTAQTSGGMYTFTQSYSAKKFFNITDVKDNFDRLGSSFGSDPSEQAYFNIWCQPVDKLTNTGGFTGMIVIDYIVELSEPKEIPDST